MYDIMIEITTFGKSKEDGLIEAVCIPEKRFIWGIQWHPEFSYLVDESSRKIFLEFIRMAGEKF